MTIVRDRQAPSWRESVRCPVCRSEIQSDSDEFTCLNPACRTVFPVVHGIPVLINDARSIFSVSDFTEARRTTGRSLAPGVQLVMSLLPTIDHNLKATRNYARFTRLLLRQNRRPRVLVVGGGSAGEGMKGLLDNPDIELVETDVYFGDRTRIICDGHDLPFADESFDAVVVQAVLEHVIDPFRCAAEIWRVLKPQGLVYAETPFMQQVHLGPYDFMRFTHLGHRKLFSHFDEISSGALAGAGSVLAWACEYFLLSFTRSRRARMVIRGFIRLTLFWLKYVDYYVIDKPGTYDNASGHYFLGRKAKHPISDREIVAGYRGAIS
jgi:SAM-dependent methyltransferase